MVDHQKVKSWIGYGVSKEKSVSSYFGELILDPDKLASFNIDIKNAGDDLSAGRIQQGEYLRFVESVNRIKGNHVRSIQSWSEHVDGNYLLFLTDRLGDFDYAPNRLIGVSRDALDADSKLYESVVVPLRQYPNFQDFTTHAKGNIAV